MKRVSEYNFLDPAVVENPFEFHRALRAQAPVYEVPGIGLFLVSTYAGVLEVLSDPRRFSSSSGPAVAAMSPRVQAAMAGGYPQVDTLITCDPPRHIRYRSLVSRAFSARRVAGMEDYIRGVARELLRDFVREGTVDLVPRYAVPLPLSVIADQLGVPRSVMALF